jgi:hypothetical protein
MEEARTKTAKKHSELVIPHCTSQIQGLQADVSLPLAPSLTAVIPIVVIIIVLSR